MAHFNLGLVLQTVRKDYDGAEAAYRTAIAADPRHARAHSNLGFLLMTVRKDFDGAEAAYRRAIVVDPRDTKNKNNLKPQPACRLLSGSPIRFP